MSEVGIAYVTLAVSARGIKANIEKELGPVTQVADRVGQQAGANLGKKILSSMGGATKTLLSSLNDFGGKINKTIMTGMKVGIGAGMAAIGVAIAKGFQRLKGIDDAQAKLRGLGHDAKSVEAIMKDALASVKGTAFGLDHAATTAAMAVAAGVKPGKDLERTLRLTADAAAIAGVGLDEMGAIFGKVASANRLSMREVNQLAIQGIPIMEWLGESYGKTAAEARKMVEKGEVDFERFRMAVEKNIGGAALEMGNSWSGAWANMWAAASRFGAALIGPIFDQMKGWFVGVTGLLDDLTAKVEPWAKAFGERVSGALHDIKAGFDAARLGATQFLGPFEKLGGLGSRALDAFVWLVEKLRDAYGWFKNNREMVERFAKPLGMAVPVVMAMASAVNLAGKAFMILKTATPIGILIALVGALIYAWQNSEKFRKVVTRAFEAVQPVVTTVLESISGLAAQVGPTIARLLPIFADTFQSIAAAVLPVLQQIMAMFQKVFPLIVQVVSEAMDLILPIIEKVLPIILALFSDVFGNIMAVVQKVMPYIQTLIESVLKVISGIIKVVTGIIEGDWRKAWEGVRQIFSGVWEAIKAIFKGAWALIESGVRAGLSIVKSLWEAVWGSIRVFFGGIWSAMQGMWNTAWGWISGIPGKIKGAFSGAGSWLASAGRAVIDGLLRGLTAAWTRISGWVTEKANWIKDKFKSMLRIGSPSKIFIGYGQDIMEGLRLGLSAGFTDVERAMTRFAGDIGSPTLNYLPAAGLLGGYQEAGYSVAPAAPTTTNIYHVTIDASKPAHPDFAPLLKGIEDAVHMQGA